MYTTQRRVVHDSLRAGNERRESAEAHHRHRRLRPRPLDLFQVQDDPRSFVGSASGDDHELRAPGGLPIPFEVQGGIGFVTDLANLAGLLVHLLLAGLAPEQGGEDLASA